MINKTLDQLCPPLASTPLLQDKCLRVVFSVGVETVIIDAMTYAHIGKLSLQPKDMLASDDTEDVFGSFMVDTDQLSPRD